LVPKTESAYVAYFITEKKKNTKPHRHELMKLNDPPKSKLAKEKGSSYLETDVLVSPVTI